MVRLTKCIALNILGNGFVTLVSFLLFATPVLVLSRTSPHFQIEHSTQVNLPKVLSTSAGSPSFIFYLTDLHTTLPCVSWIPHCKLSLGTGSEKQIHRLPCRGEEEEEERAGKVRDRTGILNPWVFYCMSSVPGGQGNTIHLANPSGPFEVGTWATSFSFMSDCEPLPLYLFLDPVRHSQQSWEGLPTVASQAKAGSDLTAGIRGKGFHAVDQCLGRYLP